MVTIRIRKVHPTDTIQAVKRKVHHLQQEKIDLAHRYQLRDEEICIALQKLQEERRINRDQRLADMNDLDQQMD